MLSLRGIVLIGVLSAIAVGGWFVHDAINSYQEALTEVGKLEQEREQYLSSIESLNKQLKERQIQDVLVAGINIKREEFIEKNIKENTDRKEIINDNKDKECVNAIVPVPISDSLLSYARDKNSGRN